jgi:LacI family transcriptional regulator
MMQRARDADPPPATVADIARAAGVSTATVDRVLHGRPNVRPLTTDVADSPRVAYVGIDHRSAGRTAALLIGRLSGGRGGEVATIAGSLGYRGHEEREMGFLGAMRESFPELRVIRALEGRDDADTNYRHARALLRGSSLLPAGVRAVEGEFRRGDPVSVMPCDAMLSSATL